MAKAKTVLPPLASIQMSRLAGAWLAVVLTDHGEIIANIEMPLPFGDDLGRLLYDTQQAALSALPQNPSGT